ncbi:MAG: M1 family metallopeptidase [Candidatus Tectimicrobiota bacterium]
MRTGWVTGLLLGLSAALWCGAAVAQPVLQQTLQVTLQPARQALQVTATITLPPTLRQDPVFVLHAHLPPVSLTPGVHLRRQPDPADSTAALPLAAYHVVLPPGLQTFRVRYEGVINHTLSPAEVEYHLGMRDTAGVISAEAVYLSGATAWYPQFGAALLTFQLDVQLPPGWEAISQGERTRQESTAETSTVRWESSLAQESIYLIAGPFTVYSQPLGPLQAMVFLRQPDAALARTYLDATARYLHLYQALLGPYLYSKFALVENLWESGFGMPSFTLLGGKVLRLPFIVHSAYAHEMLHNWWGNGVFINAREGNWAEGLTAYLADHLLQEQRGHGAAYRRGLLQKYTHAVSSQNDLPLSAFRARHNAATAAIGYGKALMLFHMLRQQLGDSRFLQALRTFYRDYALRRATFGDVQQAFAALAGDAAVPAFMAQWLTRAGAPALRLGSVTSRPEGDATLLQIRLEQTQPGPAYHLQVPVAVSLQGVEQAVQSVVAMSQKQVDTTIRLPAPPRRLDIDPDFDVFRRLHAEELPPAFSQMFGAPEVALVLPRQAAAEMAQGYQHLAQVWARSLQQRLSIHWDDALEHLPPGLPVWLFGWENRFLPAVQRALTAYGVAFGQDGMRLEAQGLQRAQHTIALCVRHPEQAESALAWVAGPAPEVLAGLGRKLPHYGTYSFLAFTGAEPVNILQGQWPVLHSPLSLSLPTTESREPQAGAAPRRPRPALAPEP